MAAKTLGVGSAQFKTTTADKTLVFVMDTTTGTALKLADGDTCVTKNLASTTSTATNYFKDIRLTNDEKGIVFTAGTSLRFVSLAGGTAKTLTSVGVFFSLLDKHLLFSHPAYTPMGMIPALNAVPFAGGTSVPLDVNPTQSWAGSTGLIYKSSTYLRFIGM